MSRSIEFNTVEEQVYRFLLNDIRSLKLPPGSRVNENKIAEDLRVSRSPVRDAIKRLKGDRLIVTVPNKGAFVRKLSARELDEMYEVRLMMELYALENVALPLREEDGAMFSSLLERTEAAFEEQNLAAYLPADFALHKSIVALCRNEYMDGLYEALHWQLYLIFLETEWDLMHFQRIRSDHREIVRHLLAGDAAEAKRRLADHIARAREIIVARSERGQGAL